MQEARNLRLWPVQTSSSPRPSNAATQACRKVLIGTHKTKIRQANPIKLALKTNSLCGTCTDELGLHLWNRIGYRQMLCKCDTHRCQRMGPKQCATNGPVRKTPSYKKRRTHKNAVVQKNTVVQKTPSYKKRRRTQKRAVVQKVPSYKKRRRTQKRAVVQKTPSYKKRRRTRKSGPYREFIQFAEAAPTAPFGSS